MQHWHFLLASSFEPRPKSSSEEDFLPFHPSQETKMQFEAKCKRWKIPSFTPKCIFRKTCVAKWTIPSAVLHRTSSSKELSSTYSCVGDEGITSELGRVGPTRTDWAQTSVGFCLFQD